MYITIANLKLTHTASVEYNHNIAYDIIVEILIKKQIVSIKT